MQRRVILASASPRRLALLLEAGISATARPAGIPESPVPGECAEDHVARLAEAKGLHEIGRLGSDDLPALVLAADTAVVVDGEILGKPVDAAEARRMLRALSGRTHRVLTAVFVATSPEGLRSRSVVETAVTFRELREREIERYVETGEPFDKAGAYGIQGLASAFVLEVRGSHSNVVGLPMEILPSLFRRAGATWPAEPLPRDPGTLSEW